MMNFCFCSILVSYNDIIKISDFGTCKELSEKSAKMTFTGTVAWMAPEMIRNEPCSEKVDIWLVLFALKLEYIKNFQMSLMLLLLLL